MVTHTHRQGLVGLLGVAVLFLTPNLAAPQESKSAALASQLAQLMDQQKLSTFAAKDPSADDVYVAAMYFPNSQLLVVSARYAVPVYENDKLGKKEYMEVYIDLNSAFVPGSKVFVSDLQANGLVARPEEGQPFDTFESGGKVTPFNSDWQKQNLSQQDYMKLFSDADSRYTQMLTVLVSSLKKK